MGVSLEDVRSAIANAIPRAHSSSMANLATPSDQ